MRLEVDKTICFVGKCWQCGQICEKLKLIIVINYQNILLWRGEGREISFNVMSNNSNHISPVHMELFNVWYDYMFFRITNGTGDKFAWDFFTKFVDFYLSF